MTRPFATLLCVVPMLVLPVLTMAQGAVPTGSQDADTTAAIAHIKKMQAEAGDVSKASSQALQNLQQQDSEDSADTSAVRALLQKVKQSADDAVATTPDADTIKKSQWLENRRELDAESKTDGEVFKEVVLDNLPVGVAPDVDRSEGLNAAGKEFNALSDAAEAAKAFAEASTPSNTAGPTEDEGPLFTPEETQDINNKMNPFSAAQQILQQNMQELNDQMLQQAAKNRIPTQTQVQQSRRPQIKQGQNDSPDCSGANAIALCSNH